MFFRGGGGKDNVPKSVGGLVQPQAERFAKTACHHGRRALSRRRAVSALRQKLADNLKGAIIT